MGAAWATWKIMQYATHLQELVSAINLVKTASAASAAAQNALAVSGASAAASEEAFAAAAKTMASAQMLGYAAIIAVTAALASFIAKQIDAASENLSQKNQLDETTQAIYDQANAYAAAQKAILECDCAIIEKQDFLYVEKIDDNTAIVVYPNAKYKCTRTIVGNRHYYKTERIE